MWVADRQVTETEKQQKSIPLHTKKKGNNETNSTNMATTTACRQLTAANTSERNQTGESSLISSANGSDDMWDDFCYVCDDACNEITGLMGCCATCPRVFHAKCHVPKYNVKMEDLPDHWRCVICLPYEPLTDQSDEFGEREKLLCAKVYMVCFEESDQAERFLKETVDYHAVIKQPIWFDAIADKISNGVYENVSQFVDDMNLLFQNIATLYPPKSRLFAKGRNMHSRYVAGIRKFLPAYLKQLWHYTSLYTSPAPAIKPRAAPAIKPEAPSRKSELRPSPKKSRRFSPATIISNF